MSADTAPNTTQAERDARALHDDGHGLAPAEIAIGVIIGRTSEFFDFFVYAIASVLVFPKLVFPHLNPLTGTLWSFAIFALAFVARPVGTVIFTAIDRIYGRGAKLTIALFLLGGSTAAIAFLPSYESAGLGAALLLALFRMGQGVALGGSWDGLASLLAINAPEGKRGWYAMIPQLGAPIGFALASLLFGYFVANLSSEDFLSWGWRYPFFVAFAINVVALFARLRLVMTKEFGTALEQHELEAAPIRDVVRIHGRDILIGAFVPLASFAMFHLVTIFPLGWMSLYGDQPIGAFMLVQTIGAMVGILAIIASGLMADRIGRRGQLAVCAVLIAIFSFVGPIMLGSGSNGHDAFVIIGFGVLGLSFGQATGSISSRFGRGYRYTGAAFTSDLAWLVGAGFAPLVALSLSSRFGLTFVGYYLLSGAICTLAALAFSRALEQRD